MRATAPARRYVQPTSDCTAQTMRCADARDYNRELRPCCRAHVREIMVAVIGALTEAGSVWFADYGTLLGAVRNPLTAWSDYPWLPQDGRTTAGPAPGIVPHDKDADLGALWRDVRDFERVRRALRSLRARGFGVVENAARGSLKVRLSTRNFTNVDVFYWHRRPSGMLYRKAYAPVDAFKGREFPEGMLRPLSTVEWEGLTLPAPADPAAFLEMRYGPSWRTPIPANNDGVER